MGIAAIYQDKRIYLDANILIYLIEGYSEKKQALEALACAIETDEIDAITSELSLAEVLVQPCRQKNSHLIRAYEDVCAPRPSFNTVEIDRVILYRSAEIRAEGRLKLADAIHVATAMLTRCDYFLTEDKRLDVSPYMKQTRCVVNVNATI